MSLNDTPLANRIHIGFFGLRNAGKSSVVNAVTGQDLSVVSNKLGTTTDPVSKAMELLPLGPVVIIDTPGFDDEGELGSLRVQRTKRVLNKTDISILVTDASKALTEPEHELIKLFKEKNQPYLIVRNKSDLLSSIPASKENEIYVSAVTGYGIHDLKEKIGSLLPEDDGKRLIGDIINQGELIVLVVPVDSAAPKGRLILPQQQTIRDILDSDAVSIVVKETELKTSLSYLSKKPKLVITDSQAFGRVSQDTPEDIMLTSFSILMARYKGFLHTAVDGVTAIKDLKDNDTVLIAEGCTHHRQCGDIGSVKLPAWLRNYTKKSLNFEFCSGGEYPEDLTKYSLVIHCGGCMLPEREISCRMKCTKDQGIPFTNYGTAIAFMHDVLKRSLKIFPDLYDKV